MTSSSIIGNLTLDPLSDSLNNLFWDYSAAKLYAAISSNTSELLYGVDMTTGDFTPLLATAPNFDSYGLTAIDSPNHVIYSITEAPTNLSTGLWSFDLVKGEMALFFWVCVCVADGWLIDCRCTNFCGHVGFVH